MGKNKNTSNIPPHAASPKKERESRSIRGYKIPTLLRKQIETLNVAASVKACYYLLFAICDQTTGEFTLEVPEMVRLSGMHRQTLHPAFQELAKIGLVESTSTGTYRIKGYESELKKIEDAKKHPDKYAGEKVGFFRVPAEAYPVLANCVEHHSPETIDFFMELLDRLRVPGSNFTYRKDTLKAKLKTQRWNRVLHKLGLINAVIDFSAAAESDQLLAPSFVIDVYVPEPEAEKFNLRGRVAAKVHEGIRKMQTAKRALSKITVSIEMTGRKMGFILKAIVDFVQERDLKDRNTIDLLASLCGSKLIEKEAENDPIQRPYGYFRASLPDMLAQIA